MTLATMHREDVKAALRKQFGSIFAFERQYGLPSRSVSDTLRGRPNERVVRTIETALAEAESANQSDKSDDSGDSVDAHRLNSAER